MLIYSVPVVLIPINENTNNNRKCANMLNSFDYEQFKILNHANHVLRITKQRC